MLKNVHIRLVEVIVAIRVTRCLFSLTVCSRYSLNIQKSYISQQPRSLADGDQLKRKLLLLVNTLIGIFCSELSWYSRNSEWFWDEMRCCHCGIIFCVCNFVFMYHSNVFGSICWLIYGIRICVSRVMRRIRTIVFSGIKLLLFKSIQHICSK